MKFYHQIKAKLLGKNSESTPVDVISAQMHEVRQLPLGMQEFEDWSDRIISGLPSLIADPKSQKFALATMLMHLGPQESHKPDIFFFKTLLKAATNQVAYAHISAVQAAEKAEKARIKADADAAAAKIATVDADAQATLERAKAMMNATPADTQSLTVVK